MLEGQQLTRRIQLGQGISSIGDGIWFTTWAIYLTQVLGFPAAVMGAAVGIGGLTGVGLAFPGGMAADRYGSRNTLIVLTAIRGLAMLGFCFVGNAWTLFPVTIGYFGTGSAVSGVWTTLVCELFEGEDQMGALARLRVVQHAGYATGSGLGAGVLARIIHRTARNRPRPPNTWARNFIAKNFIKQPIRIVVSNSNGLALIAHFS